MLSGKKYQKVSTRLLTVLTTGGNMNSESRKESCGNVKKNDNTAKRE
jgi:hypothetical protein